MGRAILFAGPALLLLASFFVPPIAQDAAYHAFADQRTILGIANFWNVVSNAAFLTVAVAGVRALRSRAAFEQPWERTAFVTLIAGTVLVAFGSAYYHAAPDSATLFWDRLPMTIVFMSLFATTVGERIDAELGRRSLLPLLAIGLASVVDWRITGDLKSYAAVQFYPMIAILALVMFRESRYTDGARLYAVIAFYAAAKLLELFDRHIGSVFATGGHPWKHLASAAALGCYVDYVARRRLRHRAGEKSFETLHLAVR